jgi:uncharacterized protein (DUF952 family)
MQRDIHVYKVLTLAEWAEFESNQNFTGSVLDKKDGFIHISAGAQLQETLDKYYKTSEDIVLVALKTEALSDHIKWEVSRGGEEFPHYYAPLQMNHVDWHERIAANAHGRYDISDFINATQD